MTVMLISELRADPPRLDDTDDIVANLEADIQLDVDGHVIYEEVSFPVAELAVALVRWLETPSVDRSDFEFDSMSAEESGLVWIRRVDGGWRIGSIHQERPATRTMTSAEVEALVLDYLARLSERVETTFGPRVSTYLERALGRIP